MVIINDLVRVPRNIKMKLNFQFQLFVMFYLCPKELLQLDVAAELFNRGWRYHKIFKRWVARLPNVNPSVRHDKYEQGEYQYFDPNSWSRERKFMILEYAALAKHAKK